MKDSSKKDVANYALKIYGFYKEESFYEGIKINNDLAVKFSMFTIKEIIDNCIYFKDNIEKTTFLFDVEKYIRNELN